MKNGIFKLFKGSKLSHNKIGKIERQFRRESFRGTITYLEAEIDKYKNVGLIVEHNHHSEKSK